MKDLLKRIAKQLLIAGANIVLLIIVTLWMSSWLFLPLVLGIVTDLSSGALFLIGCIQLFVMMAVTIAVVEWMEDNGIEYLPDWVWSVDPF